MQTTSSYTLSRIAAGHYEFKHHATRYTGTFYLRHAEAIAARAALAAAGKEGK